MYIDECGTDDIVSCHIPQHQHLALTGVILSLDDVRNVAVPGLDELKAKHFPGRDPDSPPLILHRSDFLAAKKEFHRLRDKLAQDSFIDDLEDYLAKLKHTVITVVIDKHAMMNRFHWLYKEPYHYCAEVLAEKFVQFLERNDSTGDVFAESRKNIKNKRLQNAFLQVCENGSQFVADPGRYAKRLSTFDIGFREKKHNNCGIQIADVYAKPSMDMVMWQRDKQYPRSPFSIRFGRLLYDKKYDRSPAGYQLGYGMKYL